MSGSREDRPVCTEHICNTAIETAYSTSELPAYAAAVATPSCKHTTATATVQQCSPAKFHCMRAVTVACAFRRCSVSIQLCEHRQHTCEVRQKRNAAHASGEPHSTQLMLPPQMNAVYSGCSEQSKTDEKAAQSKHDGGQLCVGRVSECVSEWVAVVAVQPLCDTQQQQQQQQHAPISTTHAVDYCTHNSTRRTAAKATVHCITATPPHTITHFHLISSGHMKTNINVVNVVWCSNRQRGLLTHFTSRTITATQRAAQVYRESSTIASVTAEKQGGKCQTMRAGRQ